MSFHDTNVCRIPKPRWYSSKWIIKHERNLETAKHDQCEIIFIGDSIIANMKRTQLWNKYNYLNCVNFGIGGDKTENVLYRIQNGEIRSKATKIVILLVGTNNNYTEPFDVLEGILECVDSIQQRIPNVHIILPTLLPRGLSPNVLRRQNLEVNRRLEYVGEFESSRKLPGRFPSVHVMAIDQDIVQKNGEIPKEIMYDYLHLTELGYVKCFTPIFEKIVDLLNS